MWESVTRRTLNVWNGPAASFHHRWCLVNNPSATSRAPFSPHTSGVKSDRKKMTKPHGRYIKVRMPLPRSDIVPCIMCVNGAELPPCTNRPCYRFQPTSCYRYDHLYMILLISRISYGWWSNNSTLYQGKCRWESWASPVDIPCEERRNKGSDFCSVVWPVAIALHKQRSLGRRSLWMDTTSRLLATSFFGDFKSVRLTPLLPNNLVHGHFVLWLPYRRSN